MLLFIPIGEAIKISNTRFQNIVCYCLSVFWSDVIKRNLDISKHRMLLFIHFPVVRSIIKPDFKTSYVTVYLAPLLEVRSKALYFKTSYVTVYHNRQYASPSSCILFQNIVCYCLSVYPCRYVYKDWISKHRMLLFILRRGLVCRRICNFKTSYVTVYRSSK